MSQTTSTPSKREEAIASAKHAALGLWKEKELTEVRTRLTLSTSSYKNHSCVVSSPGSNSQLLRTVSGSKIAVVTRRLCAVYFFPCLKILKDNYSAASIDKCSYFASECVACANFNTLFD